MSVEKAPCKAAVSVSEMARMCCLSRSRFYTLIDRGVFPAPVQNPSGNRPYYDLELQSKCLDIRRTGIAWNGEPILFNRKPDAKPNGRAKPSQSDANTEYSPIAEALKSLGLTPTPAEISFAMNEAFPSGMAGVGLGEVVRTVFLKLKRQK
jgi:hypothetical protein